jgi:hypothetical protein
VPKLSHLGLTCHSCNGDDPPTPGIFSASAKIYLPGPTAALRKNYPFAPVIFSSSAKFYPPGPNAKMSRTFFIQHQNLSSRAKRKNVPDFFHPAPKSILPGQAQKMTHLHPEFFQNLSSRAKRKNVPFAPGLFPSSAKIHPPGPTAAKHKMTHLHPECSDKIDPSRKRTTTRIFFILTRNRPTPPNSTDMTFIS